MSKKDGPGYTLPAQIDAPRVCVTVPVPDDPMHRAAFIGAIKSLGHWYTWNRDDDHTGRLVAAVWRAIFEQVAAQLDLREIGCQDMQDVRQNPETPCILEKTFDGVTWVPFADLSLCMPTLHRDPVSGHYQWSPDGVTFYEFPDGPYVENAPPSYPPPEARTEATEEDRLCYAAANAAEVMRRFYAEIGARLEAAEVELFDLIMGAAQLLGPLLGLSSTLTRLHAELAGILGYQTTWDGAPFSDTVKNDLKCLFLDNASDITGVVTFDYNAVYDGIQTLKTEAFAEARPDDEKAYGLLLWLLPFLGGDGLNKAGSVTVLTTADCEQCYPPCEDVFIDLAGGSLAPYVLDAAGWPNTTPNMDAAYITPHVMLEGSGPNYMFRSQSQDPSWAGPQQYIIFVIDLGQECTVHEVSGWHLSTSGQSKAFNVTMYDENYVQQGSTGNKNVGSGPDPTWVSYSSRQQGQLFTDVPNTRYIAVEILKATNVDFHYSKDWTIDVV